MSNVLRVCLSPKFLILAVIGLGLLAAGLAVWGLTPQLILSVLPVLGIIACLVPCLLPLYWLRQSNKAAAVSSPASLHSPDSQPPTPLTEKS